VARLSESPRIQRLPGTGDYTWTKEEGWLRPDHGRWGSSEQLRAEARTAFEAEFHADALAGFLELARRREVAREEAAARQRIASRQAPAVPDAAKDGAASADKAPPASAPAPLPTTDADSALGFYLAECYFHLGNYEEALAHYRKVYREEFPSAEIIDKARERVFAIGLAYLKRNIPRVYFFGIFRFHAPEYGIEILVGPDGGLVTENPHLSFADDALMEVAEYYYKSEEYPEAVPIYDRVAALEVSEWKDSAEFKAALSVFNQVRGIDYDHQPILDAQRRFLSYMEHYPRSQHAAEARQKLREIAEMEGTKNLRIAKFYLRESKPRACEIFLRDVLIKHPNSAAAREAREIQKQLDRTRDQW
jgi:tetratricopeptide (TPR) repeat protein